MLKNLKKNERFCQKKKCAIRDGKMLKPLKLPPETTQ